MANTSLKQDNSVNCLFLNTVNTSLRRRQCDTAELSNGYQNHVCPRFSRSNILVTVTDSVPVNMTLTYKILPIIYVEKKKTGKGALPHAGSCIGSCISCVFTDGYSSTHIWPTETNLTYYCTDTISQWKRYPPPPKKNCTVQKIDKIPVFPAWKCLVVN